MQWQWYPTLVRRLSSSFCKARGYGVKELVVGRCPKRGSSLADGFFCDDTAHIACPECGVYQCALHASVLCPSEICAALRNWRVQFTATLACLALAFALGDRLLVDKPPSVDEVRPKVVIRGKEFFVPEHYPKDASGV